MNNWNVVQQGDSKIVWKDVNETSIAEIREVEQKVKSEPFYCNVTKSVVFKTKELVRMERGANYSELEMISRYLTTEEKLYEVLNS